MNTTLSAIVLAKNEERNIIDCLESLSWCDEIIIIDDESNDRTVDLVKQKGIKIFSSPYHNDFARMRNFGLERANGLWAFFIDADERVSLSLQYEILSHISDSLNQFNGYKVKRIDEIWGRKLRFGEAGNTELLRLAKKDSGKWVGKVHEVWKINGKIGKLKNPLVHYPHRNLDSFLKKINLYTDMRAQELYEKKRKGYWLGIIAFPTGKFLLNYFLKRGFMDGAAGFVHAMLMSFHSFLVRGKLWLLWQKKTKKFS